MASRNTDPTLRQIEGTGAITRPDVPKRWTATHDPFATGETHEATLDARGPETALRSADPTSIKPRSRRIVITRPYPEPKVQLLGVVADANHCGVIWDLDQHVGVVFGFDHDLAAVELLFTSLLVQATRAMTARGSQVDWSGRNRTRSFRRSFLMGFANRIGYRLRQSAAEAAVAAETSFGSTLVPMLAERKQRVVAAMDRAFPDAAKMRTSTSNLSGWFAGEEAADRADLGNRSSIAS